MTATPTRTNTAAQEAKLPQSILDRARDLRLDRLLLPLDGSDESEQTLPFAAIISKRLGSEFNLFHCLQPMHPVRVGRAGHIPYPDAQHDRGSHLATSYLKEVKARLKPHGISARWNVATGSASHLIAYRAATGDFGLTMVAARTKPRVVSGIQTNVSGDLWKHMASPLFLINRNHTRLNGEAPPIPETIFIPLTDVETFQSALPMASALSALMGSRLVFLASDGKSRDFTDPKQITVAPQGDMTAQDLADDLTATTCDTEIEGVSGGAIGIARRQLQDRGSWVVSGSHMRSGIARLFKSSKSDNFLRQCRGPLIVVPTPEAARARDKRIRKKVASAESTASVV